jgi:hypothetical protein
MTKAQLVDAIRMLERARIIDYNGHRMSSVTRSSVPVWRTSGRQVSSRRAWDYHRSKL